MAATLETDGLPVTYRFEYGPTAAYGFQTTTRTRGHDARAAGRHPPRSATSPPAATIHYRVVAHRRCRRRRPPAPTSPSPSSSRAPASGPTTAKITSAKLDGEVEEGRAQRDARAQGQTDSAANLTVTLRRSHAAGTKPVKGWTVKRAGAGAFTVKLALPKCRRSCCPASTASTSPAPAPAAPCRASRRDLARLVGPKAGIVVDAFASATKNGAPATRLPGDAPDRVGQLQVRGAADEGRDPRRLEGPARQQDPRGLGAPAPRARSRRPTATRAAASWPRAATRRS